MKEFKLVTLLDRNIQLSDQVAKFYRDSHIQIAIYNTLICGQDSIEIVIDQFSEKSKELDLTQYFADQYLNYCSSFNFVKINNGLKLELIGMKVPNSSLVFQFRDNISEAVCRLRFRLSAVGQFIFED